MFNHFKKVVFYLILFLLPSQLAKHYWPDYSLLYGARVDYLSPAIYFVNLLIFITGGFSVWPFLFIFNILFSINPINSFFSILNFSVITSLYYLLKKYWQKQMVKILLTSFIFIIIVGFLQFMTGKTLGGLLYYFGERHFNLNTPGIALFSLFGYERLRAYSIFSHPNSFVSYVVVLSCILLFLKSSKLLIIAGVAATLLIANSLSAYLALIFSFLYAIIFNKKFVPVIIACIFLLSLLLTTLDPSVFINESSRNRVEGYVVSKSIISNHFVMGVGLNNYLVAYKRYAKDLRYLQPVHNVYLLVFSETGLFGFLLFYCLLVVVGIKVARKNIWLKIGYLYILFTSLFDHYWWTLNQNKLIFVLYVFFVFANLSKVNKDEYV